MSDAFLNENLLEDHGQDVDSRIPFILGVIGIVVSSCGTAFLFFLGCTEEAIIPGWMILPSLLCCIVILCACITAVLYGRQLSERNEQDYRGKMRIIGIRYQQRTFISERDCCPDARGNQCKSCVGDGAKRRYYDAYFQLDWGYAWACPEQPQVNCSSSQVPYEREIICHSKSCSAEDTGNALERLQERMTEHYFGASATYTPYNATIGPSNDVDWPSIVAYGDCNSCYVRLQEEVASPSHLDTLRNVSLSLGAIGCGSVVLLFLIATFPYEQWRRSCERRRERRHDERRQPQETVHST